MGFGSRKPPTFRTLLHAMTGRCRVLLAEGVASSRADRYVKKYKSADFALGLVSYYLLGIGSLRQLKDRLDDDRHLAQHVHLRGISYSQLPKLLEARPPELWGPVMTKLLWLLNGHRVPSQLRLMDTSFFAMSVKLFARIHQAEYTPEAAGMKLGMVLDPANGAPVQWDCKRGQGSDLLQVNALIPENADIRGLTYIFDRGFLKYDLYHDLIVRGAHFITRGTAQLVFRVLAFKPTDPAHPEIIADEMVLPGSRPDRTKLKEPLRRIILQTDSETLIFLTSRFDLTAFEITELYRRRWEIEIFFRWLKCVIDCQKPLAYGERAAEHTLYAAIVAYLLIVLLAQIEVSPNTKRPVARIRRALNRTRAQLHDRPTRRQLKALGFT